MAAVGPGQILELALNGFRMHPVVVLREITPRRDRYTRDQEQQEHPWDE